MDIIMIEETVKYSTNMVFLLENSVD